MTARTTAWPTDMPCTVLVAAADAATGRPPLLSHSFDTPGGVDFRLVKVPAAAAGDGPRPVFRYEEEQLPRFSGDGRGPIPAYTAAAAAGAGPPEEPGAEQLGELPPHPGGPSHSYFEAASGIANEVGLMMAECTCSAIFGALPRGTGGGQALLGYMELTRVALERCSTAREAIEMMGGLAEATGFYGNTTDLAGAAESLAVIDTTEAWVFHILADDTGSSAIWAAQRLPDGHAAAVCNMFVIRQMELQDSKNFLYSKRSGPPPPPRCSQRVQNAPTHPLGCSVRAAAGLTVAFCVWRCAPAPWRWPSVSGFGRPALARPLTSRRSTPPARLGTATTAAAGSGVRSRYWPRHCRSRPSTRTCWLAGRRTHSLCSPTARSIGPTSSQS